MQPGALFPHFQRHLFFDKVPETVSNMLLGTYGKRIHFLSIVFSLSPGGVCGCGNRHHSGHCWSEIAFTDQSTRTSCIQPGDLGALHCRIVHRDGQCTLSLVWTQRTKERFYCEVWQVLFADCVCVCPPHRSPLLAQSFCLLVPSLLQQFHYICIILHFMTSLLMISSYYPHPLFLAHLDRYTLFFLIFSLFTNACPQHPDSVSVFNHSLTTIH